MFPATPNIDANPSTNPSLIPPPELVLQLSELVAKKEFEAMERAGIVFAGVNGEVRSLLRILLILPTPLNPLMNNPAIHR